MDFVSRGYGDSNPQIYQFNTEFLVNNPTTSTCRVCGNMSSGVMDLRA